MVIEARNLVKGFGAPRQDIIKSVSFVIPDGDFVAITGKSGSGKSTLLYMLSTLDQPTSGDVLFENSPVSSWSQHELHRFRNVSMGFVFQFHHLLPELTALENILLPARKTRRDHELKDHAVALLEEFGLSHRHNHFPGQLSGGEQQRVAIARAVMMSPRYLFADEPTGNLDSANAESVMKHLRMVNQRYKTTVVIVTHDPDFARRADRIINLIDGTLEHL